MLLIPLHQYCFLFCREKFHIGKNCRFHCSWKLVALSLTALTLVLSSVIAYFGGKKKELKIDNGRIRFMTLKSF